MPRKPRTRTLEQAQRIRDAAAELFAERGFTGTSMRDIAARFDMNPGSLYVYIGSKEQLLQSIVDFVSERLDSSMTDVEALDADPVTALKLVARGELAVHVEHPAWYSVYEKEYRHLSGEALESALSSRKKLDLRLQAILRQGELRGIFREMSMGGQGTEVASAAFIRNLHDVYSFTGTVGDIGVARFADVYADYLFNGWFARQDGRHD